MPDALDHIEAAISEISAARERVRKPKSQQVKAAEERNQIKAVAFAWFKTHRPHLVGTGLELAKVDAELQTVLDSTDHFARRTTYANAFKKAQIELTALRSAATSALGARPPGGAATTPDPPPAFANLSADPVMQAILSRRWAEVQRCIAANANLAATVMMGGLLESLLLARIVMVQNKAPLFTAKTAPRDKHGKTLPLNDWKLVAMVEVGHEVGWLTKSAKDVGNVLRDFRNYVHPHKEHTDGVEIGDEDAKMFWEVSKSIARQVLGSVGSQP